MELTALKAQIKEKKLGPCYVFTGPEIEVMRIYIRQMAKVMGAEIKNLSGISELTPKFHTRSALQNRFLYVLRDCKEFLTDEGLQAHITQINTIGDSATVFVYTSIDKRSRLYKNYQDLIVEFEPLKADVLTKYIQREVDLNERNCQRLIEVCESDYSRILLEVDKIKRFGECTFTEVHGNGYDANKAFEYLLNDGTIYSPPRDAVFMFVDAVLKNKPKLAFSLLNESYASGEATMILLSNLYNGTKQLLQVQSYKGDMKLTEATKLTPFQVKLASERRGNFSNGDLVYLMRCTRDAEKGIKTGEIEEMMAVPYVLTQLWN